MKTTAFTKYHIAAGAKMAEFAGYNMPIEFSGINDEHMTVLIITHNSALAPMAHKIIRFRSGKVISQEINEHPTPISDIEW